MTSPTSAANTTIATTTTVALLLAAAAVITASIFSRQRLQETNAIDDGGDVGDGDGDDDYDDQLLQQQGDRDLDRKIIVDYEAQIAKLEELRRAERTGRIRAEMKIRSFMKSGIGGSDKLMNNDNDVESAATATEENDGDNIHGDDDEVVATNGMKHDDNGNCCCSNKNINESKKHLKMQQHQQHLLQLQPIGTIVSPYTKRMGTPRQGALVPSGRGYVQITNIPMECLDGMESYSHAWIIFSFHANTDINSNSNNANTNTDGSNSASNNNSSNNSSRKMMIPLSKTKIRPPRGNGLKVGMLATRSPHRPNNIGLSLVKISHLDRKHKRLHITALDLVNGTPVYDIKPVVPWDIPGQYDSIPLVVPQYVSQEEDVINNFEFTNEAMQSLKRCVQNGKLSPLYTTENNGLEEAKKTIGQILAQDPRASNSNGPNKRGSTLATAAAATATAIARASSTCYKMLFCSVEIEFQVRSNNNNDTDNDGKDVGRGVVVTVKNVNDDLDLTSVEYVDGIPILLK